MLNYSHQISLSSDCFMRTAPSFDTHQHFKKFIASGITERQAEVIIGLIDLKQRYDLEKMATKEQVLILEHKTEHLLKEIRQDIQKLDSKIDDAKIQLDSKIDDVKIQLESKINQLDSKIDNVRAQLESKIDNVRTQLESKIDDVKIQLESKINQLDSKIDNVRAQLESKIDDVKIQLESKIDALRQEMKDGFSLVRDFFLLAKQDNDAKLSEMEDKLTIKIESSNKSAIIWIGGIMVTGFLSLITLLLTILFKYMPIIAKIIEAAPK